MHLAKGRGDRLEAVAGAEVGAEGADGGERVEERLRRGGAVVGESDVEAVGGGGRREEVLAQVAAAAHHKHPLPLLLRPRHLEGSAETERLRGREAKRSASARSGLKRSRGSHPSVERAMRILVQKAASSTPEGGNLTALPLLFSLHSLLRWPPPKPSSER